MKSKNKIPIEASLETDTQTRRHRSTTSQSTTETTTTWHTDDSTTETPPIHQHYPHTLIRPSIQAANLQNRRQKWQRKTLNTPTKKPRTARAKQKTDKQDNTDKMDMATILKPGQHDTTGQSSNQSYRHKTDTMVGQHQRQEAPYICEEGSHHASHDAQERSPQCGGNSHSIWSSNGQSPTDEFTRVSLTS